MEKEDFHYSIHLKVGILFKTIEENWVHEATLLWNRAANIRRLDANENMDNQWIFFDN